VAIEQEPQGLVFDPSGLDGAQRAGRACAGCGKRWPRPTVTIGWFPDGRPVRTCVECVPGGLP